MEKYVLSIDQGTTSSRAILFDKHSHLIEKSQREIKLVYPHNGWVEADPIEIWISVLECVNEVLIKANITIDDVECIGITNQRESVVVFDKNTGKPVYNSIIWQSRQSAEICERYEEKSEFIYERTGLKINPYFSASKIKFILENVPGVKEKYENDELYAGTIDSWILYKLTNKKCFKTDVSNACRTMLFNINTLSYDKELLNLFGIKESILPEVQDSSSFFGHAEIFKSKVPITSIVGDQQAALFGQTCFAKGEFKNTYGTGCFLLLNTGDKPIFSKNGLLTSVGWKIGDKVCYILEGSIFIGGASVQWLRDNLKCIEHASESEELALKVRSSRGVYFVPAFVGLGAPYWDDDVRGAIFNLTKSTTVNHIARATLEAIAYQTRDVFEVMKTEFGGCPVNLKADGGATANDYLMQFQSDLLGISVSTAMHAETTALGAAYLAGLYTGYFKNCEEIRSIYKPTKTFVPEMAKEVVEDMYEGWKKAVRTAQQFKHEN